jgi:hypothetical protein
MCAGQVPPQHKPAPTAFDADNVVPMNRSADGYCWRSLDNLFPRLAKVREGLMNSRDQARQLICRNLIVTSKCSDDVGR